MQKKCRRGERLTESVYFTSFIRGIAIDQDSIYVVCSAADSQVFKLDKNLNPLRVTGSRSSEHFGMAYALLVTKDHVLVCSAKKICILNLNLDHKFNLNLDFVPYGITILNGKYFITGDTTIGVIDIDFEKNNFKIMKWTRMEVKDGNEDFQENSRFRGICASNEYLLVTEVNKTDSNYRRLLCLQLIENRLRCVDVKRGFSEHCIDVCDKEICSPVVVTHCNEENDYYSQGYFDGVFHIVRVIIENNTLETKKLFDCST